MRASPNIKIVKFDMGDPKGSFDTRLHLVPKASIQIRQEALEAARQTSIRLLEKQLGKSGFHLKIRTFPFHILRENPLASGAGADRMSTGMAKSFGKPIGRASQVKAGKELFTLSINMEHLNTGKKALERASKKMPCGFSIRVEEAIKRAPLAIA
ncbi:hypothetical protein AUJ69_03435 [Candidatus Woesearchaeota archaeon CG1_02_47_18]|nr:MAG: hypothetical protein AUJ69_03435 [Candidatus Woesearchaeota archaeon CG1_02_47_18]